MNNAKQNCFRVALSNVRPKEGLHSGVQNSNANLLGFLAQNSWTTLSVSMRVSLYACRRASPESLSPYVVDIDTKQLLEPRLGPDSESPVYPCTVLRHLATLRM